MANVLKTLSDALASAVESTGPSIVRVDARRRLPASGVVWSSDGLIVSAHHVIEQDTSIGIGLADGKSARANLVGRDPSTDVALLRAEAKDLLAAPWKSPDSLKVGHMVLALGRPGRTVQATLGIVSAFSDSWRTPGGGRIDHFLQTDVEMAPGFSGGPLVNAAGEVMGINTSGLVRGLSLAVPLPTIERVVEALVAHGRIRRGYLGIGVQPVRLPAALESKLGQDSGLLLISVEPGSPAEDAGLLLGDTLVAFDGQAVRHMDEMLALLGGDRVGATLAVKFVRGGQLEERKVTVGERQ